MSCPDRRMILLYADNELGSPWNERVSSHIRNCSTCKAIIQNYASLSQRLQSLDSTGEAIVLQQMALWQVPSAPPVFVTSSTTLPSAARILLSRIRSLWRTNVSLPLPVLAASAMALIGVWILASPAIPGRQSPGSIPLAKASSSSISPGSAMSPVTFHSGQVAYMPTLVAFLPSSSSGDFAAIVRSLQSQAGDSVMILLPESASVPTSGEPVLMSASTAGSPSL